MYLVTLGHEGMSRVICQLKMKHFKVHWSTMGTFQEIFQILIKTREKELQCSI
jgi:hypothetical protein